MDYLKISFRDIKNVLYNVYFSDENYDGVLNEISGRAILSRPKVKNIMEPIRGSELKVSLELSNDTLFISDYLSSISGDKEIAVRLTRGTTSQTTIWSGFLKPDGIYRDYIADRWITELECIDGLGYLKDTAFLSENGEQFRGRKLELLILRRCLELTGLQLNFNIYDFDIFYTTDPLINPVQENAALLATVVNQDRYIKTDNKESVFSCEEVIDGLLKKYGATIFQYNNEWHVVRIRSFYEKTTINKRTYAYNFNNDPFSEGQTNVNATTEIGSQINGRTLFHASKNQSVYSKGSLGAYKVVYTYGFVQSIIQNPNLIFGSADIIFLPFWAVFNDENIVLVPSGDEGDFTAQFLATQNLPSPLNPFIDNELILQLTSGVSNSAQVGDAVNLNFKMTGKAYLPRNISFLLGVGRVKFYASLRINGDDGITYYLDPNGGWTTEFRKLLIVSFQSGNHDSISYTFESATAQTPVSGIAIVQTYIPFSNYNTLSSDDPSYITITRVEVNGQVDINIKGESHTARRISKPMAVVDLEEKVYVGDNEGDIYIGGIEGADFNNTVYWAQRIGEGFIAQPYVPLLQHLVTDRLKLSGANSQEFKGSVYGEVPYLSRVKIDGFSQIFMITEHSWNIRENITEMVSQSLSFENILDDTFYEFNYESGNIQRPTIE